MHCLARAPHMGTYVDFLSDNSRRRRREREREREMD